MIQIKSLKPIKFKDKAGRGGITINLIKTFGFHPLEIVIQKVGGENNKIVISAVLTDDELVEEAKRKKEAEIKEQIKKEKKA